MITSLQIHHRYGDKRCVPCGVNKERFDKEGCSSADCPWRNPPRMTPEEVEAKYGHLLLWRIK